MTKIIKSGEDAWNLGNGRRSGVGGGGGEGSGAGGRLGAVATQGLPGTGRGRGQ